MKKIFLIYNNPSGYEETPSVIGFTLTEDEAKIVVEREKELYLRAVNLAKEISTRRNEFTSTRPPLNLEQHLDRPKWASGISATEITAEMRKERDGIIAENQARGLRNTDKTQAETKIIYDYLYQSFFTPSEHNADLKKSLTFSEYVGHIGITEHLSEGHEYFYEEVIQIK